MLPFALDAASGAPQHLDPTDLTRHAVCVGMTGSGKTGLCVALLESLAARGVPLLCLDPKGDLTNLALQFPGYPPEALTPWLDPVEAARSDATPAELASRTANRWRRAQADSGLSPRDHAAFVDAVDIQILTPGALFGTPIDVLTALTTPPPGVSDPDVLRAYVTGAVTALLGLVGLPADPLRDPPAILLSRLLLDAFTTGEALSFDTLLARVVDPPFDQLGVFGVDQVLSRPDRRRLALDLNAVLAAPAFGAWRQGVPLDLDQLLAPTPDGRTPVRVLTLSHLDDRSRMFFVALLLHRLVAWTRRLEGTSRLRALLFFDEVFGFLPPHPRNPASKPPLLTLLKQARSVGVGVTLATQNPVDLDYKALSNAGTWFLGRLQTEQDVARVTDGLGRAGVTATTIGDALPTLPKRSFVWRDPTGAVRVVRSRQTLSLLRGPLTRRGLERLLGASRWQPTVATPTASGTAPPVPEGVHVRWWAEGEQAVRERLRHPAGDLRQPAVLTRVEVTFDEGGWIDHRTVDVWVAPGAGREAVDARSAVQEGQRVVFDPGWIRKEEVEAGRYGPLPRWLETEGDVRAWVRQVREAVQVEAVAEGPSGVVRAEFGDVRVVWVGVVWG